MIATSGAPRPLRAPQAKPDGRRALAGAAVLQPDVTAAITRAAFRELARTGYAALSMEAVAHRAGVGKAAIYRRWPSKLPMVADLLARVGSPLAEIEDTGSLEGDLRALLARTLRLLRRPLVRRLLPDLHAEMARTPALGDAIRSGIQVDRRTHGRTLLHRAVARGELRPGFDEELALDLVPAVLYWRVIVTGGDTGPAYLDALTAMTLAGLRTL